RMMGGAQTTAQTDRAVEGQCDDVDAALLQLADHPSILGVENGATLLEDQAIGREALRLIDRDLDLVPAAQRRRQAVDQPLGTADQQTGLDQGEGPIEMEDV